MNLESKKHKVSIVRYESPLDSVRKAVDLCEGLEGLPNFGKVFMKPNVVTWTRHAMFPKWGVITTSRIVEDMVILLKERGIKDITIGEGMVLLNPKDKTTPASAFEALGYNTLNRRYGVKVVDIHQRPFKKVQFEDGIALNLNPDFLESDFVINMPVLKTHAQTMVSLGIKNIKGTLDVNSRKKSHSADPGRNLNYMIAKFAAITPPCFTILDGIYTNERGPAFDGQIRRSNILIASPDLLSTDKVGAKVLGFEPSEVPHLLHAADNIGRLCDLSDVEIHGVPIEEVTLNYEYSFPYTDDGSLPTPMKKMGIHGLSYRKYDLTLCTYCTILNGMILSAISKAWKGEPWDEVEVLTGKLMKPTPGKKKTILLGKCMYQANKDNPTINEIIAVKGCPPSTKRIIEAFNEAGIPLDDSIFDVNRIPGFFMKKYKEREEFDESFFEIG